MLSGLIGGLPITSVVVRTAASVEAGARTRMSAFIHGVLLLASVILLPRVLRLIPLASLAAILIVVGFKLTKPSLYRKVSSLGWDQFVPFLSRIRLPVPLQQGRKFHQQERIPYQIARAPQRLACGGRRLAGIVHRPRHRGDRGGLPATGPVQGHPNRIEALGEPSGLVQGTYGSAQKIVAGQ